MMLTLWWVMSREAPELRRFQVTAVISVCSVQNRKMQTAMAITVLEVRIQLRLRCFRTNGANFIINPCEARLFPGASQSAHDGRRGDRGSPSQSFFRTPG